MKADITKTLFGILIVLQVGCQPHIRFAEPQPKGKRDLKAIPKPYQGEYYRLSDSTLLFIKKDIIYREWNDSTRILKYEMKERFDTIVEQDTEVEFSPNSKLSIKIFGDSALVSFHIIDTVFILDENNVLRKYKGYLFLNYKKDKNSWKVELVKLKNGFLDFKELVSASEIDTLKKVINISTVVDTSTNKVKSYKLNPKIEELKDILKRKEIGETYKKL